MAFIIFHCPMYKTHIKNYCFYCVSWSDVKTKITSMQSDSNICATPKDGFSLAVQIVEPALLDVLNGATGDKAGADKVVLTKAHQMTLIGQSVTEASSSIRLLG